MKRLLLSFSVLSSMVLAMDRPEHDSYILAMDELTVDEAKTSLLYRISDRDHDGAYSLINKLKKNHQDVYEAVMQDKEVQETAWAPIEKSHRPWSEIGWNLTKATFCGFCATTGALNLINEFHKDKVCRAYKNPAQQNQASEQLCNGNPADAVLPVLQTAFGATGLLVVSLYHFLSDPLERPEYVKDFALYQTLMRRKAECERDHARAACVDFSEGVKKKLASITKKKDSLRKQAHQLNQEERTLLNQLEQEQTRLNQELEKLNTFFQQLASAE